MIALQTARLDLRPFSENDLDDLSTLMANADFMRFSLGVCSREETAGFLEKVRQRDRDGLPSRRVAEKNGMRPEKETVFRGFPTIVFGISREARNGT